MILQNKNKGKNITFPALLYSLINLLKSFNHGVAQSYTELHGVNLCSDFYLSKQWNSVLTPCYSVVKVMGIPESLELYSTN
jgi:hypothetical protein